MKELIIKVESIYNDGEFQGFIQYDDGVTSIAKRYNNIEEFLAGVEDVYELSAPEAVEDTNEVA